MDNEPIYKIEEGKIIPPDTTENLPKEPKEEDKCVRKVDEYEHK